MPDNEIHMEHGLYGEPWNYCGKCHKMLECKKNDVKLKSTKGYRVVFADIYACPDCGMSIFKTSRPFDEFPDN